MPNAKRLVTCTAFLLAAGASYAHHSRGGYDLARTVEFSGLITAVEWGNPHVRIEVRSANEQDDGVVWILESSSPSALTRNGVSQDAFAVGETVEVAGYPALESQRPRAYLSSIRKADGTQIVLPPQADFRPIQGR